MEKGFHFISIFNIFSSPRWDVSFKFSKNLIFKYDVIWWRVADVTL